MYEAIIFDLDGTLTEVIWPKKYYVQIKNQLLENLFQLDVPEDLFSKIDMFYVIRSKVKKWAEKKHPDKVEFYINIVDEYIDKYGYLILKNSRPKQHLMEVLTYLKNKFKMGLFTFSSIELTKRTLQKIRVQNFFDAIVARNDVFNPKPHPDHLKKVIEVLNVKPQNVIVVGDSVYDYIPARMLHITTILINSKYRFKDVIHLENLRQLIEIL